MDTMGRPSWDEYFLDMADLVSTRATCERAKHGAVLVRDRDMIASGYNGSPPGYAHCTELGCRVENNHCVRTIHAEDNSILRAAKIGVSVVGATIYVTAKPCERCNMRIITAGIFRIIYRNDYLDGVVTPLGRIERRWA